jgi:hypothetical protein
MARARGSSNGRLEEAMALLINNQAAFNNNQTAFVSRLADMDRENAQRFARIEAILADHSRILGEHSRILAEVLHRLDTMEQAIREKIGFKQG